ncbi:radical SAM/SPASM domain-containing protein [Chloroflexota bacterium]
MNQLKWKDRTIIIHDPVSPSESWEEVLDNSKVLEHPAFKIPEETILGIPNHGKIRKDSTQIIYYGIELFDSWTYRLNSAQLVVLSLFNGRRTLREVEESVAELSDCNLAVAKVKVRLFLSWLDYPNASNILVNTDVDPDAVIQEISAHLYLLKESRPSARLDQPITMMIMPTDKCLTNCVYCYACRRPIDKSKLLTIKRFHELIEETAKLGVISINLDGGDLFARKEHLEIIEHIESHGISAGISTKGYLSKEHASRLQKAGLRWIQVGLDSTEEMADRLVRQKGYFNRTIETIHNLVQAGVIVRTNSIITRKSLSLLPELVDLLMSLPLMNIKVAPAFGSLYRGTADLLLSRKEKQWFREQMMLAEEKYSERKNQINWECRDDVLDLTPDQAAARFKERPLCSSGRTQLVITPDGKAITCEMSPQDGEFVVGDCSYQSIMEVWESKTLEQWWNLPQEKFTGTPCYNCEEFHICVVVKGHCWFDALVAYGTPFTANPDCPKATCPLRRWK